MSKSLMDHKTQLIITLCTISCLVLVNATCSKDELSFKEASYATKDFARISSTKEISLCVVPSKFDTCQIDWYKDGQLLLADNHVQFLNNKQQLRILDVVTSDAGNYSCTVISGKQQITRGLELKTYVDEDHEPFNTDYSSCRFADTMVGADFVSATCRFDVGSNPDDVVCDWMKQNTSAPKGSDEEWLPLWLILPENKYDDTHCKENSSLPVCGQWNFPENTQHVYLCLTLYNITQEDFGSYRMTVDNGKLVSYTLVLKQKEPSPVTVDYGIVAGIIVCVIGLLVVVVVVGYIVKVDVQLFLKDTFSKRPVHDGKKYDAYISHTDNDTMFVLCLKQQLEKKGYHVYIPAIDNTPGGCTLEQIAKALEESRRFIMVLSPDYIGTNFAAYEVAHFVEKMSHYKKEVISIVFKNTHVEAENCRAILRHVLKIGRVVQWPELLHNQLAHSEERPEGGTESYGDLEEQTLEAQWMEETFKFKVYKELLLGMPPKPKGKISEPNGYAVDSSDSYRMNGNHLNSG